MAAEILAIEGIVILSLVVIYRLELEDAIVEMFADITHQGWEFLVDTLSARLKVAGGMAIDGLAGLAKLALRFSGGLLFLALVTAKDRTIYGVKTYAPVITEGIKGESKRFGAFLHGLGVAAVDIVLEYGPPLFWGTVDALRMLVEELYGLMMVSKDRTQEAIERALK